MRKLLSPCRFRHSYSSKRVLAFGYGHSVIEAVTEKPNSGATRSFGKDSSSSYASIGSFTYTEYINNCFCSKEAGREQGS